MTAESTSELSPNKQALLKIRQLQRQIEELERGQKADFEPIAIVSMACRFPRRSATPELFWQSLIEQTEEITEIPEDRWDLKAFHDDDPNVPGRMYARHGAFLEHVDLMDPEFFGISPREATWVDPQQRLLMEVGWEALERAGWRPSLIGEQTGIFVGWMHNDYQNESSDSFLNLNPYIATGAAGSFLCGRLAYYLGLQGPSVAVDTACSSSLVALHLACRSIQQGDCDRALVGGVNAICSPTTNILTCKLKALSPSGHSRAFDAAADGYVRGEGCGVVTLRRLSDALRDGDPVLGIIRGSAIGHNGFSSGLTAPNPTAQQRVIEQALQRAQFSPSDVAYLEAHGTGTELGDPIEMRAAAAALATDRQSDTALMVGSVKTNIGHLEAAAGMAGLLKVLLSMQHGHIPGQLNFEEPNPHIPWDRIPVKVLTEATPWPQTDRKIAGVSAFGMSGTNAHVVLSSIDGQRRSTAVNGASPPVIDEQSERNGDSSTSGSIEPKQSENNAQLLVLSGKSDEAVTASAERLEKFLSGDPSTHLSDVGFTLGACREHFDHRLAIVAADTKEAVNILRDVKSSESSRTSFRGNGRRLPKVAWQFTGQGSQYVGMARGLYDTYPVFRETINQCDAFLHRERGRSLKDVLFKESDRLLQTEWTQPAVFALQMGIVKLLESFGLSPDMVLGHSVGQYAAACVAGVMSWEDGLCLIAERGRLIGELPPGGKMLAVFAPQKDVEHVLNAVDDQSASIAALNGTHVVVSGAVSAVDRIAATLQKRNVRCKPLSTSHAFHSALMDPVLEPFAEFADQFKFGSSRLPLICNVTGEVLPADQILDGAYWSRHIREPVRYSTSINAAQENGCDLFLEIGPQSTLTQMATANWRSSSDRLISCLNHNTDDATSLLKAVGSLYVHGVTPDFESLFKGTSGKKVVLPTYPFQRRRFWGPDKPRAAHAEFHTAHSLLGHQIALAGKSTETRYASFIEPDSPSWLPDHEVMGRIVVPGAAFVEMALQVAAGRSMNSFTFDQPLQPTNRTPMQSVVSKQDDGSQTVEVFSASDDASQWTRHFSAQIAKESLNFHETADVQELEASAGHVIERDDFYRKMHEVGLNYGPEFQTVTSLRISREGVFARLRTNSDLRGFTIPPPLLDGAFHALAAGLVMEDDGQLFLPVEIERIECFRPSSEEVCCHAVWRDEQDRSRTADLTLMTNDGEVIARITGLRVQQISRDVLRRMSGAAGKNLIHEMRWQSFRLPNRKAEEKTWLLVDGGGCDQFAARLSERLAAENHKAVTVSLQNSVDFTESSIGNLTIDGASHEHWSQTLLTRLTSQKNSIPDGIVWLLGGEEPPHGEDLTQTNCEGLLHLLQALQEQGTRQLECGLLLVTTNAMAVSDGESCDPRQTEYWGFGRVLGAEQPGYRCRLIDLDSVEIDTPNATEKLIDLLLTETRENQLALRNAEFVVPRLQKLSLPKSSDPPVLIDPDASYLITGGLGMLGRQAASWLADLGAKHIVLTSRRGLNKETQSILAQLGEAGCEIVVHTADVSLRNDVADLFERFSADLPPLKGIIHAAGLLDDALVDQQTWDRFQRVLAPKVFGAHLLHEFTRTLSLDFFVLYSSAASILGSPGQSNYATGNAFLDGLAWERQAAGLPALSINWGPWSEGMADDERIVKRLAAQGISPLIASDAHAAMEQLLSAGITQATVMDADWTRLSRGLGGEAPPLLESLVPKGTSQPRGDSAFVSQLKGLKGAARRGLLAKTIQESLQKILATPELPEPDRPLIEMGLDSLMAVEFSTELQMMLGDEFLVGPTMLFDHPSVDAITEHILDSVAGESTRVVPRIEVRSEHSGAPQLRDRESIAIVGLSCRFPGAHNADEFWENLLQRCDSVCEIPPDRWDIDRYYDVTREPGKMYTRHGGFLDDIADFDADFFNLSDEEACWMDPQHRLLLENSYLALEDAGISPSPLADANVGVFMGIMGQDYAFLPQLDDEHIIQSFQGAGLSHSAGVGRISYAFGFEGPSIAVDTASSSSLVAVYQAMRSLQDGNCNMALAGGVNAILAPVNSLLMSKAGLLSPDGRCKSFSAKADGFGRGEGCGVIVLKRLSDAEQAGDRVLAVLRGGAVVHNGFTGGITSPSGKAQSRVIHEALEDAGLAPSQIQYLEAHGTGTELGDPMELGAAATVYGRGRKRDEPLLVGSVKANISHLEAAGGISGLIKTVLSLHHGLIPPQANFDEPSPHVPWNRLPVKVVNEQTPWPETEERIAGVTALGLVGTNAHMIVSGAPTIAAPTTVNDQESGTDAISGTGSELLVLSARNNRALNDLADRYQRFLTAHPDITFSQVCRAAATERQHFEHRLALTAENVEEVLSKLQGWHHLGANCGVHRGQVSSQPQTAWVFPDRITNLDSVARELAASESVFQELLVTFDARLAQHLQATNQPGLSLADYFASNSVGVNGHQPLSHSLLLFIVQSGLAHIWKAWSSEPDTVLGVGIGQYVAACVAGGLSFEDALLLVVEREKFAGVSPSDLDAQNAHLDQFEEFADSLNFYPPSLQLICSQSGQIVPLHRSLGGSYWREHVTTTASNGCIETLNETHTTHILQFGAAIDLEWQPQSATMVHCLNTERSVRSAMLDALACLYTAGINPTFKALFPTESKVHVDLPKYPFQKRRFWITEIPQAESADDSQTMALS